MSNLKTTIPKSDQVKDRLSLLLINTEEPSILIDENLAILSFNKQFEKQYFTHFGIHAVNGDSILNYSQQNKVEELKKIYEGVFCGKIYESELEIVFPSKAKHTFLIKFKPAYDENEKIIAAFVTSADITEKIKLLENQRLIEKRFQALIENSNEIIISTNSEGEVIYVSPSAERILGFNPKEIMDKSCFLAMHPNQAEESKEVLRQLTKYPGVNIPRINRFLHKNGNYVWVEGTVINLLNDPNVGAIVSNYRDITQKIIAEKQKEYDKRDKEALINNTEDLIWSVTKDYKLVAANKAFIKSILASTGKIIKHGDDLLCEEFYTPETIKMWQDFYSHALEGKPFKTAIYNLAKKTQSESWLEISFNPIYNEGEVVELACHCREITENKLLQEKLKQSEKQFRGAFKYSAIGMALFGLEGNWLVVNDSFCNMIGYSKSELLALNFQSLTHPEDLAKDLEVLKDLVGNKIKSYQLEKRYIHKNGTIIWVLLVVSLVKNHTDRPIHIIAQIQDITQEKQIEKELKESHELLQKLTDKVPIAVYQFEMTDEGVMTFPFMSKGIEHILPETNIDLIKTDGLTAFEKIHTLDLEKLFSTIQESKQKLTNWELEFRVIVDDKLKWIKGSSKPEKKENNNVVWYGYLEDITERKLIEDDIRIAKERYDIVAKATNDATYEWNLKTGEVTRADEGFKNLFGYDKEAATVEEGFWEKRIHPEDLEGVKNTLKSNLAKPNNHLCNQEYRFKKSDGTYAFVYDKGYIIRDEHGEACRMIGATQDISERVKSEILLKELNTNLQKRAEELAISNSELEQFAYVTSHDLQEPLRMITSFLNLLETRYKNELDDKAKQYIHFATDGAARMRKIILDLLEYSKVGTKTNEDEQININDIL